MVDRLRNRRVFVAGDAAHIHSPLGGQGIATGIQDASNLAWKLFAVLREGAPDSLLDTFDEERKPIARTVLRGTSAASNLVFTMNPVLRFVRERIIFPIMRTAFAQRLLFAKVSQLEIRYRSSLAVHEKGAAGVRVRAGDRAPDVVFANAETRVSLFELLGKFGWVALLGRAGNNPPIIGLLGRLNIHAFVVSDKGDLRDVYSDFFRLYGVTGPFLYLIRPDGHIGLFQGEANPKSLARYLQKLRAADAIE
jgi:FAD binding domain